MTRRHPATAESWEWDEGNEGELAQHRIMPTEVYQVYENGPKWAPNVRRHAGDWKMMGRTKGGRRLTIVVRFYGDRAVLRPITGWDTTSGERARYFEGR
jgi:IS5 family transposase